MKNTIVSKFQHLVFYVEDLDISRNFYTQLFNLQVSAVNHPHGSAAMTLAHQEMNFLSFGFYHHDICMVKHHKLKMDNDSMLHYTMVVPDKVAFDTIYQRVLNQNIPYRDGRMLPSAKMESQWKAFCFQDPNKHWIEIIYKPLN
jgi:catechol 2,3-dioxygenase-like lactoylglutathione lyase family enzyme